MLDTLAEPSLPSLTRPKRTRGGRTCRYRSLEVFTGAGGLALGTHLAGFDHAALVEWNADACNTLEANARTETIEGIGHWRVMRGDARQVSFSAIGHVDLVAGGPPCQPFSIGGKHGGMSDERDMIPEFVRAVRELAPRAFIMENVRGLTRPTFSTYFSYVILQLTYPLVTRRPDEPWLDHLHRLERVKQEHGGGGLVYRVTSPKVLNAADYGVPQTRVRVFVVGFRDDIAADWHYPTATHSRHALIEDQWATGAYWERRAT